MENKNFNFCLKVPDKIFFSVPQNIEFFKNNNQNLAVYRLTAKKYEKEKNKKFY